MPCTLQGQRRRHGSHCSWTSLDPDSSCQLPRPNTHSLRAAQPTCPMTGMSQCAYGPSIWTAAFASSCVSRAAPAALLSPISMKPAGIVHSPLQGSMPLGPGRMRKNEGGRGSSNCTVGVLMGTRDHTTCFTFALSFLTAVSTTSQHTASSAACVDVRRDTCAGFAPCTHSQGCQRVLTTAVKGHRKLSQSDRLLQMVRCIPPTQQDFVVVLHHTAHNHLGVEVVCTSQIDTTAINTVVWVAAVQYSPCRSFKVPLATVNQQLYQ